MRKQANVLNVEAARQSLCDFYRSRFRDLFLPNASTAHLEAFDQALKHWATITGDPPLGQITIDTLGKFRNGLHLRRLAVATVNKQLRYIQALLDKAGPQTLFARDALEILRKVPYLKREKEPNRNPKPVRIETVVKVYLAAAAARFPCLSTVAAGEWWQTYILAAYTTGFRRRALLSLTWPQIDFEGRTIRIDPEQDKAHRGRIKPLHEVLLAHLQRMARDQGGLVFPWPHSKSLWYYEWRRICMRAGLEGSDRITPHDLKRACGQAYAAITDQRTVQAMLDHASILTTARYDTAVDRLRPAVEALNLPRVLYPDPAA